MHAGVAQSLLVRRPTRVGGFVALSVAAHLGVGALAVAWGMFARPPPLKLDQAPIKASLVRLGKERDKKLLPRIEKKPPPPKEVKAPPPPVPAAAPPKPVEKAPVPGVKPEPPPRPQEGAKEAEAPRPSLFDAFSKAAAKPEELEGAADGDPFGDSAVQEGERYYGALKAQVRRYYDVTNTLGEQERLYLRAQVLIRIGRKGQLLEASLARASGNALFDSEVLAAAKKASPFSPPPDHLRAELEARGILLEFTP